MLTGYNTDVSYGGETFHIQTEDKGIDSPIILSLVYRAGTILAAKRTSYGNLIQNGVVDEEAVLQLLNRQHQILVAAVQSGKSDKLAELSRLYSEQKGKVPSEDNVIISPPPAVKAASAPLTRETIASEPRRIEAPAQPSSPVKVGAKSPSPRLEKKATDTISFDQIIAGYLQTVTSPEQLRVELLYPSKFRSGDEVTVRLAIFVGGHKPAPETDVQLQVLGTKIAAQCWSGHTDSQGLASFQIKIPAFTAGAAALVIKATGQNGQEAEAKFMIGQK